MHQPSIDPRRPAQQVTLTVTGLHCTNCSLSLEKHLLKVGAHAPSVDYATGRTTFSLAQPEKLDEVVRSIGRLGYSVVEGSRRTKTNSRLNAIHAKTLVSLILTLPMLGSMFFEHSALHNPWIQGLLATPVFIIGLLHFGASGIRSIRAGAANMDVLISIGICAGYVASVISLFLGLSHEMIFFEATSSIVTFVLIGHLLEERAVKKTTSAIEGLAALQPLTAQRLARAGEVATSNVETITLEEIGIGDLLQVNTGDVVPTDAIVEHGSLSCNEMMLSGESLPVEKSSGSRVIGGSTVVDGSASIRAVAIGDDTTLASIIHLVQDAQQRKPEIQRIGDAVSAIFVPAVVITSAVVLIAGMLFFNLSLAQAIVRALAIAVVACPCAMGLATPTAIMVALGKAANSGILIRGGDTLERLAAVKAMAFDKTGTLTTGELAVGRMQVYEDISESDAKGIIATLQRNSSHPIAKSLVRAFAGSPSTLTLTNVTETRGVGLEATGSDGAHYVCGGSRVKERFSIQEPGDLVLVKNGVLAASIYLQDSIRSEAFTAIDALRSMLPSLSVISGDNSAKVKQVGEALGIADLHSEQLPEQKLALIRALQASNPIAYVGDGINDAPTLTEASVGISLSSASDVAVNSAQVILSGNSLQSLPKALQLARLTVRTIKQNLFWAFLYNVIAIPLAAFGYIAPLTGALLMTFSDVIIVSNSLRIKFFKLR